VLWYATERWTSAKKSGSTLDAFEMKYKQSEEPNLSNIIKLKGLLKDGKVAASIWVEKDSEKQYYWKYDYRKAK
jgi:hypothetical protein